MTTIKIKKEMHQAIDVIDDKDFLQAIYSLLNKKSKEYDYELSDEEKRELDQLRKLHKAGKSKSYTVAEVRKNVEASLKRK